MNTGKKWDQALEEMENVAGLLQFRAFLSILLFLSFKRREKQLFVLKDAHIKVNCSLRMNSKVKKQSLNSRISYVLIQPNFQSHLGCEHSSTVCVQNRPTSQIIKAINP